MQRWPVMTGENGFRIINSGPGSEMCARQKDEWSEPFSDKKSEEFFDFPTNKTMKGRLVTDC